MVKVSGQPELFEQDHRFLFFIVQQYCGSVARIKNQGILFFLFAILFFPDIGNFFSTDILRLQVLQFW